MSTNIQARAMMCAGVVAWLIVVSSSARAQGGHDGAAWPQFRGPNVDGVSTEQGVWSDVGAFRLDVAWRHAVGEGMSSVAIANGLAVTMTVIGDSVWVVALETGGGAERWRHEVDPIFPSPHGNYDGPMSTPLIAGDTVVALDRWGHLVGLDVGTGDQVWSHDLPAELGTRRPPHGFASSPILVEGTVVVQGGGADAMVVGFDPATGVQVWATGADNAVYQTPVPIRSGNRRHVVAAGFRQLIGAAAAGDTQLEKIVFEIVSDTEQAAAHTAEALGFVKAATFSAHIRYFEGKPHDLDIYVLRFGEELEIDDPAAHMF